MPHVIPLFKKGDNSLVSNYRPVALLCCISKVLEKIVYKHLYNHLHQNRLLYKFQSGFLPGHSTNHQLIELYHEILLALDNSQLTSVTLCDISRAFDRVWIRGLLLKLKRYGIKDTFLRWLNSYLENINQRVVLKDGISEAGNLRAGVPQGSVMSPLLFLVYVNDIADEVLGLCKLFADDTSIAHSAHDSYDFILVKTHFRKSVKNFIIIIQTIVYKRFSK
jgi:hypothetical protein